MLEYYFSITDIIKQRNTFSSGSSINPSVQTNKFSACMKTTCPACHPAPNQAHPPTINHTFIFPFPPKSSGQYT